METGPVRKPDSPMPNPLTRFDLNLLVALDALLPNAT